MGGGGLGVGRGREKEEVERRRLGRLEGQQGGEAGGLSPLERWGGWGRRYGACEDLLLLGHEGVRGQTDENGGGQHEGLQHDVAHVILVVCRANHTHRIRHAKSEAA